jgi:splicing factor 3B subunit 1
VLYEGLRDECPEVVGAVMESLWAIVEAIGVRNVVPSISEVIPRVFPLLRNGNDSVVEKCLNFLGRLADLCPEVVTSREWIRIAYELLELLSREKKSIRRSAVNCFGYIAKSIGPSDLLSVLIQNLKGIERRRRVCTSIAIAILAESCYPFTVLPYLFNEYKTPDLNVQNGILKALSFTFEYIGEISRDYVYSVLKVLEDALIDRNIIHRQTAAYAISHLSIGVSRMGLEDAILHLLNFLWPNIFETTAHIVQAMTNALEGIRLCLGAGVLLSYSIQGLFHPARAIRVVYARIFNFLYISSMNGLLPQLSQIHRVFHSATSGLLT